MFLPYVSRPVESLTAVSAMSVKKPFDIHSRDGKRWHNVTHTQFDAFGDVMFMDKNNVVRRVSPGARVRISRGS